jgi:hypothetical protein
VSIHVLDYAYRKPTPIEVAVVREQERRELEFAQALTLVRAQAKRLREIEAANE